MPENANKMPAPEQIMDEVVAFRKPYQVIYFYFEHGLPA